MQNKHVHLYINYIRVYTDTPTRHIRDRMVPMVKLAAKSSVEASTGRSVTLEIFSTIATMGSIDTVVISKEKLMIKGSSKVVT